MDDWMQEKEGAGLDAGIKLSRGQGNAVLGLKGIRWEGIDDNSGQGKSGQGSKRTAVVQGIIIGGYEEGSDGTSVFVPWEREIKSATDFWI